MAGGCAWGLWAMVLLMTRSPSRWLVTFYRPQQRKRRGARRTSPGRGEPRSAPRTRAAAAPGRRRASGSGVVVPMLPRREGTRLRETMDPTIEGAEAPPAPRPLEAAPADAGPGAPAAHASPARARTPAGPSRASSSPDSTEPEAGHHPLAPHVAVGGGSGRHRRPCLADLLRQRLDPAALGVRSRGARVRPPAHVLGPAAALLAGWLRCCSRRLPWPSAATSGGARGRVRGDPHGRVVGGEPAIRACTSSASCSLSADHATMRIAANSSRRHQK